MATKIAGHKVVRETSVTDDRNRTLLIQLNEDGETMTIWPKRDRERKTVSFRDIWEMSLVGDVDAAPTTQSSRLKGAAPAVEDDEDYKEDEDEQLTFEDEDEDDEFAEYGVVDAKKEAARR